LNLQTYGEIPFRLQLGRHDLTQPFRRGYRRRNVRETHQQHNDRRREVDSRMSKSANLFATLRHDVASKTVALEFVDSVLNARVAILS
jgi:hypothetical protein